MLIALGEKQFKTRSWSTKQRGPFALRAGKKIDKEACEVPEITAELKEVYRITLTTMNQKK
jgi:hypothetical protein